MLQFTLLLNCKSHFLLRRFLLTDFKVQESHQVLNFVDLIPHAVLEFIFLLEVLDKAIVLFLNLGDGLSRVDQIRNEVWFDLVGFGLIEGNIF